MPPLPDAAATLMLPITPDYADALITPRR